MSPPLPKRGGDVLGTSPPNKKKDARMARTLTLSALYIMALGTLFGAYAFTI